MRFTQVKGIVERTQAPSGAWMVRVLMDGPRGEESIFLKFQQSPTDAEVEAEAHRVLSQQLATLVPGLPTPTRAFTPRTWWGRLAYWVIRKLLPWVT